MPLHKKAPVLRSRRGAVAIMALIVALVMLLLFQAYTSNVLSDLGAGASLDKYTQYQGERVAVQRLVKEALLERYEGERMGMSPAGVDVILQGFLAQMSTADVAFNFMPTGTALPSNGPAFWPTLALNGHTVVDPTFFLNQVDQQTVTHLSTFVTNRRIMQYIPDPDKVLAVAHANLSDDPFHFQIDRVEDGHTVQFDVFARMYQVPVTDYNLIAYAMTDDLNNVPLTPPAISAGLSADIAAGTIHALAMSRMGGMANGTAIGSDVDFPYSYRGLFSAASTVWEWTLYNDSYITSYFPNVNGAFTITGMDAVDLPQGSPNTYGVYCNAVTHDEVSGAGTVTVVDSGTWVVDLNDVPDDYPFVARGEDPDSVPDDLKEFRRIYIQLPTVVPNPPSTLVIRDSNYGDVINHKPVVIWINGWNRANMATPPAQYSVQLEGNLSNQPVLIFSSGANIVAKNVGATPCTVQGAIILDDKLSGLACDLGSTLNINGLLAWNGNTNTVAVDGGSIVVAPYGAAAVVNPFRSMAPRYMLVDVQSMVR